MSGDADSDTLDYRPSFRTIVESNYWSDDNYCISKSKPNINTWPALDDHSIEEKNDIMADSGSTLGNDEIKNDSKENSKAVHFDDSMNLNIDTDNNNNSNSNFAPGSNISPSLLNDNNFNAKNTQISGKKRSDNKHVQSNENNAPPLAKRMRFSQLSLRTQEMNANDDLSFQDDLTYEDLQHIQNSEREKFQKEMQAAGLDGQIENPYGFQSQQNHAQQHGKGNNQNKNKHQQNDQNSSKQQNNQNNTREKRSSKSKRSSRRTISSGGGPGGDSSDDGDDDKNNRNNDDNIINNDDNSDSESQDSDVEAGKNITNASSMNLKDLQKQNDILKKQLNDSNNRIDDLLNKISNPESSSNNNNDNNNVSMSPNVCELQIYKEMIKQQQFQMNQLMRCVLNTNNTENKRISVEYVNRNVTN